MSPSSERLPFTKTTSLLVFFCPLIFPVLNVGLLKGCAAIIENHCNNLMY